MTNRDDIHYELYKKTCPICGGRGYLPEKKYIYTHEGATATLWQREQDCGWCEGKGFNQNEHE